MKKIFVILPGPIWDPDTSIKARFEILSTVYCGTVATTSGACELIQYGNFTAVFSKFELKRRLRSFSRHFSLCIRLLKRAREQGSGYDLIVCYDPLKTGLMGLFLSKWLGVPLVVEVNGVYQSASEYVDLPKFQGKVRRLLYTGIETLVLRYADGIKLLFPKQLDGLRLERNGAVVRSYFNHVDMEMFSPAPSENYLLFVGYPFFRKGVDVLLEAFIQISGQFPSWSLKIIGWFNDAEMVHVKAAQERCDRVLYYPPVRRSQMPSFMSRCSFFVLPSRSEAMGRVLIEAMACGKPRVGSRVDGIPQYIDHMKDGLLFECGDVSDLKVQLKTLMGSAELREQLGKNALDRYQREFSKGRYLELTADLYENAMNGVSR